MCEKKTGLFAFSLVFSGYKSISSMKQEAAFLEASLPNEPVANQSAFIVMKNKDLTDFLEHCYISDFINH